MFDAVVVFFATFVKILYVNGRRKEKGQRRDFGSPFPKKILLLLHIVFTVGNSDNL